MNKNKMELWKQVIIVAGAIIVAAIGAWQAVRIAGRNAESGNPSRPAPAVESKETAANPKFVALAQLKPEDMTRTEYEMEPGVLPAGSAGNFARLGSIEYGPLGENGYGYKIVLVLTNVTSSPFQWDLDSRFFTFEDNQGRSAELAYFCCPAHGSLLGPGESREVQLFYKSVSGWQGKETAATRIFFRVNGLKPLIRATWSVSPIRTAAG